jgi:hypothetical protein
MNNQDESLFRFLAGSEKDFPLSKISSLEAISSLSSLKKFLLEEASAISWPLVVSEIMGKSRDLLNIDIHEIIAAAWSKYRLLAKYADRAKYPPDETFLVPLSEHTIKSEHKPYIEVIVNDKTSGRIDFAVSVSLSLKGFIAKIQGGKIMGIKTGECKCKGSVTCEGLMLLERETASFEMPGSIDLGDGIPIS